MQSMKNRKKLEIHEQWNLICMLFYLKIFNVLYFGFISTPIFRNIKF